MQRLLPSCSWSCPTRMWYNLAIRATSRLGGTHTMKVTRKTHSSAPPSSTAAEEASTLSSSHGEFSSTPASTPSDVLSGLRHLRQVAKKKDGWRELRRLASKVELRCNADLPHCAGVGLVERRRQHDGRVITTIYPKTIYRKARARLPNVKWAALDHSDDPSSPSAVSHAPCPWSASRLALRSPPKDFSLGLRMVTAECVAGDMYYFEDGQRKVRPYHQVLDTLVNLRTGTNRTLEEHMTHLFPFHNPDWLRFQVRRGHVQVNFRLASLGQPLRHGDLVTHLKHQHEPPVLDWPIDVIYEDQELLVVNKPPSYVLYPLGSVRANSLLFVLRHELGPDRAGDLRPIHRLDKLTSGVLVLAKNSLAAGKYKKYFQNPEGVKKEYLALVDGIFPKGRVVCSEPLSSFYRNARLHEFEYGTGPKESETEFELIDSGVGGREVSLVRCRPVTGRTHQIRLHLRHLGFSIVNDSLYNGRDRLVLMDHVSREAAREALNRIEERVKRREQGGRRPARTTPWPPEEEWLRGASASLYHAEDCLACEMGEAAFADLAAAARDASFMCLHAWKYSIGEKEFCAGMPRWIEDPSVLEPVFERRRRRGAS